MNRPTRMMFALSLGLAGVLLATRALQAAPTCGPRDAVVADLASRYGETRQASGLGRNAVMELYASPRTGTWTLTVTTPDGTMCLVAAGEAFSGPAAPEAAAGDPA